MKKTFAFMVALGLFCQLTFRVFAVPETTSAPEKQITAAAAVQTDGMDMVGESKLLQLYADSKTGAFILYQKDTGAIWRSNPDTASDDSLGQGKKRLLESQLEIRYYDAKSMSQERVSKIASVNKNGLSAEKAENGIIFRYSFVSEGISIPIQYTLQEDHLQVSVLIDQIEETAENRLIDISLLPYFGAANTTEQGYFFVPDGSGSLIHFNNGKYNGSAYQQKVYGEDLIVAQERLDYFSETAKFPVLGISKNSGSVLSVVQDGAAFAQVNAYVAGMKKNYNVAYFSFNYRPYDTVMLDSSSSRAKEVVVLSEKKAQCDAFTVDYYPLGTGSGYSDMALKYKELLISEGSLTKTAEQHQDLPVYINSYGAVKKKGSFLWIPVDVMKPLTTYQDAAKMITDLKAAGIADIVFSYEGWTAGGMTGKMPVKGKYESVLGNKKDFQTLLQTAKENEITFLPGINLTDFYQSGNGYAKGSSTAKNLNKSPSLQYRYSPFSLVKDLETAPYYLFSPRLYSEVLQKFYKKYHLNTDGISLKALGYKLYSDSGKEGYDRGEILELVTDALNQAAESGSVLTTSANLYAACASDYISEVPVSSSGYDITDQSVPFYQIVMSGYKNYSISSVNLSYDTDVCLLKAMETGSSLTFDFNAQNFEDTAGTPIESVYNSNYNDWIGLAAEQSKILNDVYQKTGNHCIVGHSSLAENVYCTSFENGTSVAVNYSDQDFVFEGQNVPAKGYCLFSTEK